MLKDVLSLDSFYAEEKPTPGAPLPVNPTTEDLGTTQPVLEAVPPQLDKSPLGPLTDRTIGKNAADALNAEPGVLQGLAKAAEITFTISGPAVGTLAAEADKPTLVGLPAMKRPDPDQYNVTDKQPSIQGAGVDRKGDITQRDTESFPKPGYNRENLGADTPKVLKAATHYIQTRT